MRSVNDAMLFSIYSIATIMIGIIVLAWVVDQLVIWKIKREQRGWSSVRQRKEATTLKS